MELIRQEIIHINLPLYTLKIRVELHKISPYFSSYYKGSVLAIVLFATLRNGGLPHLLQCTNPQVGHLALSALPYHFSIQYRVARRHGTIMGQARNRSKRVQATKAEKKINDRCRAPELLLCLYGKQWLAGNF